MHEVVQPNRHIHSHMAAMHQWLSAGRKNNNNKHCLVIEFNDYDNL